MFDNRLELLDGQSPIMSQEHLVYLQQTRILNLLTGEDAIFFDGNFDIQGIIHTPMEYLGYLCYAVDEAIPYYRSPEKLLGFKSELDSISSMYPMLYSYESCGKLVIVADTVLGEPLFTHPSKLYHKLMYRWIDILKQFEYAEETGNEG